MRNTTGVALAIWMLFQPLAHAQSISVAPTQPDATTSQNQPAEPSGRTNPQNLLASGLRESTRLVALTPPVAEGMARVQPAGQNRSWISRHPVLFGTLVGAGAGALASVTMENELFCSGGDEDCFFHGGSRVFVGAGFGAGIGAVVGLIVSVAK